MITSLVIFYLVMTTDFTIMQLVPFVLLFAQVDLVLWCCMNAILEAFEREEKPQ